MAESPDAPTLERVREALADGPLSVDAVCDRLGLARSAAGLDVLWALAEGDPQIVALTGGRLALGASLAAGRRALHRIDADEVGERTIRFDEDVAALVATVPDPMRVHLGEVEVALHPGLDDEGEEDPSADPRIDLPAGWHPDLAAGDLVRVTPAPDGGLVVAAVDGDPAGDEGAEGGDDGTTALVEALVAHGEAHGTRLTGEDGGWVVDLVEALLVLHADRPEVVDALHRPLTEVLDGADMAYGGGFLAGPGVPEHRLRLFQIGADVLGGPWVDPELLDRAESVGTTWMLLLGAADEGVPEGARAAALALGLGEPEVVGALARHVRATGVDPAALRDRLGPAVAVVPDRPGPAQLQAELSVLAGTARDAIDPLATALAGADPDDWEDAHELLGHLRAVAGDLDGAARALSRIDRSGTVEFLGRWRGRATPGVGRNDPCPCGSGRKHKQCCLGRPTRVGLADRVELVWWKARTWCLRTQGLALPWSDELDEDEGDADALVLDLALVADDALAAFTVEVGSLLPDDEAALVETWLDRPHRLWEVGDPGGGDGLTLVDLTGPADRTATTTIRRPGVPLEPGEVVLALVVPVEGDLDQLVGQAVRVPPSARPDVLSLLADHPSGQVLLDRLLDLGPDALVRPTTREVGPPSASPSTLG